MNRCRVIKIGGSLFDLPDLRSRLSAWMASVPVDQTLLIAGGGALCDVIRSADERHSLGEEAAHWLCIRALDTSAGLLAKIIGCEEIRTTSELTAWRSAAQHGPAVFNVTRFLRGDEPHLPGTVLEHGWHVTTDSIAARVAEILSADELVLMKSSAPRGSSPAAFAEEGLVDRFFPAAAARLPSVQVVNLRG